MRYSPNAGEVAAFHPASASAPPSSTNGLERRAWPTAPQAGLLTALTTLDRRRRRRRRRRRSHFNRRRRRRSHDHRRRRRRCRMTAQRQDELEVAAVARDVAVELALVTDPHVDRTKLAANADARKERAALLARRDDAEVAIGIPVEVAVEVR